MNYRFEREKANRQFLSTWQSLAMTDQLFIYRERDSRIRRDADKDQVATLVMCGLIKASKADFAATPVQSFHTSHRCPLPDTDVAC
jgi:hypothetical protein